MARKTLKEAPRPRPKKRRFTVTIEAQPMLVDYSANCMRDTGHFEFRSSHKPARRIPTSKRGYRSHFGEMDVIETYESPEEYARAVVLAAIRTGLPEEARIAEKTQPTFLACSIDRVCRGRAKVRPPFRN